MPPKKITLRGKIIKKLEENTDGLTMNDLKKDKNINVNERVIRKNLKDLIKEGRVSEETMKRKQDRRANIIYKSIAWN